MHCLILFLSFLLLAPTSDRSEYRISAQSGALQQGGVDASVKGDFHRISRAIRNGDIMTLKRWLDAGNSAT